MNRTTFSACLIVSLLSLIPRFGAGADTSGNALSPILDQVDFRETPVHEAINYLRTRSRELDPSGAGANFVIDPEIDAETTVSLRLSRVSIGVALICLAEQTDLDYRIEDFACRLLPFGSGELADKERLGQDHSESSPQAKIARDLKLSRIEFAEAPVAEVIEYLSLKSREGGRPGLNLVIGHRIDPAIPVNLQLRDVATSTALSAIAKETSLEIRVEPYAIVMEPPGSRFYREQRVERAREAARKGLKAMSSNVRPPGEDSALRTPPADPRSPAHPDYVGSGHPDRSKRTNALGNVYKWIGGKWTFVRYQDGEYPDGGLRTGSLDMPRE